MFEKLDLREQDPFARGGLVKYGDSIYKICAVRDVEVNGKMEHHAWIVRASLADKYFSNFDPDHASEFPYNGEVVPIQTSFLKPVVN